MTWTFWVDKRTLKRRRDVHHTRTRQLTVTPALIMHMTYSNRNSGKLKPDAPTANCCCIYTVWTT